MRHQIYVRSLLLAAAAAALLFPAAGFSGSASHGGHAAPHWTYSGATGAEHWGELDPQWAACKTGTLQSPIDLPAKVDHATSDLEFHYKASPGKVVNNGHTIVFTPSDGGYLSVAGKQYNLLQFHFHAPSEHTDKGASYPMEGHLVSKAADGEYAVLGIFFSKGAANPVVEAVWSAAPAKEGVEGATAGPVDPSGMLPAKRTYFRYKGSLTTPPCSEGLVWSVLDTPATASEAQVKKLVDLFGNNARPVQKIGERKPVHGM